MELRTRSMNKTELEEGACEMDVASSLQPSSNLFRDEMPRKKKPR